MKLKKLTYNGDDYLYEIVDTDGYTGTIIYESAPIEYWQKKFWFFGPLVLKTDYKYLFNLNFNIENSHLSKKYVQDKFNYALQVMERKRQIENGEII
jgi:hypothetical protein